MTERQTLLSENKRIQNDIDSHPYAPSLQPPSTPLILKDTLGEVKNIDPNLYKLFTDFLTQDNTDTRTFLNLQVSEDKNIDLHPVMISIAEYLTLKDIFQLNSTGKNLRAETVFENEESLSDTPMSLFTG